MVYLALEKLFFSCCIFYSKISLCVSSVCDDGDACNVEAPGFKPWQSHLASGRGALNTLPILFGQHNPESSRKRQAEKTAGAESANLQK